MKRIQWALKSLPSRRKATRKVQFSEIFEVRQMLDGTAPTLLVEAAAPKTEVTEENSNPDQSTDGEVVAMETSIELENPELVYMTFGAGTPPAPAVSQFASREEFGEFLIERAIERYSYLFDQPVYHFARPVFLHSGGVLAADSSSRTVSQQTLEFSETNTQVQGVDEGDVFESDGEYLYVLNGQHVVIVRAVPAGELTEMSRIQVEGYPIAEYLDGDRLTVISNVYEYDNSASDAFSSFRIFAPGSSKTVVSTYDVSDRAKPTLAKQTKLDGFYVDSRAFDGQVHVLTSNDISLPSPETDGTTTIEVPVYRPYNGNILFSDVIRIADFADPGLTDTEPASDERMAAISTFADEELIATTGELIDPTDEIVAYSEEPTNETIEVPKYESLERYVERIRAQLEDLIDEVMPHYEIVTAGGLAATGQISEIEAISKISDANSDQLLSVVSIDTRDAQPRLVSSSSVFASYTNGIYANREHLYVFSPVWGAEQSQTRVLQFGWANGDRQIELQASGLINGTLHNQFSADEYEGRLRVATTTSSYVDGNFTQANNVVVLENQDGVLTQVGAIEGFASNESIYSVRFDGDRAFVVTFRRIDPLFVIDLSDPTNPTITGELEVPGYSSYIQVVDRDHLLTVGRSTDDNATKVSLYDVSDPTNPTEIDNDVLPNWTWSLAEWDHHAIGYFGARNTLAIPTSGYDPDNFDFHNESVVFRFDVNQSGEDALQLIGNVADNSSVLRNAYIGDVLYTISSDSVIASRLDDPEDEIDRIDIVSQPLDLSFGFEPLFIEADDGASDWEYINPPETAEEADDLLALAAKNVLNGQVRVTLLQSDGSITVSFSEGNVVAASEGHDTETIALGTAQSLSVDGTESADRITLNFGTAGENSLTEIIVSAGTGNDNVTVTALASALHGEVSINGDDGHDTITVASTVRSGVRISGGLGRDVLTGGGGPDFIHGGPANDVIDGGAGNDILFGGGGADQVFGRNGNDTVRGGGADDYINGGNGADDLDGGEGNDVIRGGTGDDLMRGGNGDDNLRGEDGNDTLLGGDGNDRLNGGVGNDAIAGGAGNDFLFGEDGSDSLLGGAGNDVLKGGNGADICLGEDGDDVVDGEANIRDTLSGGEGNDRVLGRRTEIDETFVLSADWLALI